MKKQINTMETMLLEEFKRQLPGSQLFNPDNQLLYYFIAPVKVNQDGVLSCREMNGNEVDQMSYSISGDDANPIMILNEIKYKIKYETSSSLRHFLKVTLTNDKDQEIELQVQLTRVR